MQAREHLADEMRDAFLAGAPPDIDDPLAEYRRIGQRLTPECQSDFRMAVQEVAQRLMRDHADRARAECHHVVVHDTADIAVEVEKVAWVGEADNLALAGPRSPNRHLRRALQQPPIPREPRQPHPGRRLLRARPHHPAATRKDQATNHQPAALASPQRRRLN